MIGIFGDTLSSVIQNSPLPLMYSLEERRKVTVSKVTWSCSWCRNSFVEERFPGSFIPILCKACRSEYRSWQHSNYYRRKHSLEPLNLIDWIEQQRASGKVLPDASDDIKNVSSMYSRLILFHAPENNASSLEPVKRVSNLKKS
jgi:hypothetical protein